MNSLAKYRFITALTSIVLILISTVSPLYAIPVQTKSSVDINGSIDDFRIGSKELQSDTLLIADGELPPLPEDDDLDALEALPPPDASPPPPPLSKAFKSVDNELNYLGLTDPSFVLPRVVPPKKKVVKPKKKKEEKIVFALNSSTPTDNSKKEKNKAIASPLTQERIATLLANLPPLPKAKSKAFRKPDILKAEKKPRVKVDKVLSTTEEIDNTNSNTSSSLMILRKKPTGKTTKRPTISLTFSQPMVPVGAPKEINAKNLPIKIVPDIDADYQWLGTQTLLIKPSKDLKLSTKYKLTVPAGTSSISGEVFENDYTWSFQTETPAITLICKGNTNNYRTILVAKFNQKIDKVSFLKTARFVLGKKNLGIRLATSAETKQAFKSQKMADLNKLNSTDDLFAFTYEGNLRKPDRERTLSFKFELPKGLKGLVGHLTNSDIQVVDLDAFENSKAFEVVKIEPRDKKLKGNYTRTITLYCSNKTKTKSKDLEKFVTVSPELKDIHVYSYGNRIYISGAFKERQKYTVNLSKNLVDEYGQKLSKNSSWVFDSQLFDPSFNLLNVSRYNRDKLVIPKSKTPTMPFEVRNVKSLKLTAYKVSPNDWRIYSRASDRVEKLNQYKYSNFVKLKTRIIDTKQSIGKLYRSQIDMRPFLDNGFGNIILIVEPQYDDLSKYSRSFREYQWRENNRVVWLNYTNIGVDTFGIGDKFGVYVSYLKDGLPINNAEVVLHEKDGSKTVKKTSADGLVSFEKQSDFDYIIPEVRLGKDSTFNNEFSKRSKDPFFLWYKVTDRNLYKPGQTVKVKGWVRFLSVGVNEKLRFSENKVKNIRYTASINGGKKLKEEKVPVDKFGGFSFSVKIPEKAELGDGSISLEAIRTPGTRYFNQSDSRLSFKIKEFRRPKFSITVTSNDTAKVFVGDKLEFSAKAKYYAGPPLSNTDLDWTVKAKPTSYSPPGWSDYSFNENNDYGFGCCYYPPYISSVSKTFSLSGETDILGRHNLKLNLLKSLYKRPLSVTCQAKIIDVDRQVWNAEKSFIAHPANLYIGLKKDKYYYELGDTVDLSVIAVDLDGKAKLDSKVDVEVLHHTSKKKNNKVVSETNLVHKESFQSKRLPTAVKFQLSNAGSYSITAKSVDDKGRQSQTKMSLHVYGETFAWNSNTQNQKKVGIDLDKQEYAPGDTANVILQAPFAPAYGYLYIEHRGLVSTRPIALKSRIQKLSLPINKDLVPEARVSVVLNGKSGQFSSGTANIVVPAKNKNLDVQIEASAKEYKPGSKVSLNLKVQNANGQAAPNTQVALAVVDESILALTNYKWKDPKTYFYANSNNKPPGYYYPLQSFIELKQSRKKLIRPSKTRKKLDLEAKMSESDDLAALPAPSSLPPPPAPGGAADGELPSLPQDELEEGSSGSKPKFSMRQDMRALAYFTPSILTKEDGRVQLSFKLPDSVTRYRVMAVAAQGEDKFGIGESSLTARMPITIKPSAPRFANFTDSFELPVVVQNQTDKDRIVEVVSRANNLSYTSTQGKQVKIAAQGRVEIRFPVKTILPGNTSIQFAAVSEDLSDATSLNLPIYSPITEETIATYGNFIKGAAIQKVQIPDGIAPNIGSITIDTSCTQAPTLQDAFLYMKQYKHMCSEQLSARVLAFCGLEPFWDQLRAKDGSKLSRTRIKNIIQTDIDELVKRQDSIGNVGLWKLGGTKWPFVSLQVARAFVCARELDLKVPDQALERSKIFLTNKSNFNESDYGFQTSFGLKSYALFIRRLMKDKDPDQASKLISDFETRPKTANSSPISNDIIAWLLPVLHGSKKHSASYEKLKSLLNNRVEETAANAFIVGPGYGESCYLLFYSPRRSNAAILEALLLTDPKNTLVAKMARGLYAKAKNGKWRGTQENAYVLLALSRYMSIYESTPPDFVSRIWMGKDLVSKENLAKGKKTQSLLEVPLDFVTKKKKRGDITISKTGDGRLYYRVGLNYSLAKFDQKKLDRGFKIERTYEAINNKGDVTQDQTGVWHFKPGALIKVKIKVTCPATRYHIAITDPLAAGTESINTDLKGSAITEEKKNWWDCWSYNWFDHQNLRDDRAEVYASRIDGGEYNYSYNIQATTPGEFIIPPCRVEEMYDPETFGRSATARVTIGN